jgi:hypothetical protein
MVESWVFPYYQTCIKVDVSGNRKTTKLRDIT